MKLGLITWLADRISGTPTTEVDISEMIDLSIELSIRKLAFQSAVNLIANAVSKCEFKTYKNNVEFKGQVYYQFNVEPNKNQNSSMFIRQMVSTLYKNNECLVVEHNDQLLVADSFNVDEYASTSGYSKTSLSEAIHSVRLFKMSDVLYIRLNNEDIKQVINIMYESYGKLISFAQKHFKKSKGKNGILKVDSFAKGDPDYDETFKKLMTEYFKDFFEADNAVLPLFEGFEFEDLGSKTYSETTSRDIKAMVDDIYDFTARAFQIPPSLLRGDVADTKDSVDRLLTFCLDPLTDMIGEEVTRKQYGFNQYKQGNYLRIDTKTVKHIDLLSISSSIDKLISSSVFNVNDIRRAVDEPEIDEPWANQHYITKNYATVEEFLKEMIKGGEGSGS